MTALTIAERNVAKTRELGKSGRATPVPFTEGESKVRRCTASGHITRFHWYDRYDPRFEGCRGDAMVPDLLGLLPGRAVYLGESPRGVVRGVHPRASGGCSPVRACPRLSRPVLYLRWR